MWQFLISLSLSLALSCHALSLSSIRAGARLLVNETDSNNSHCSNSDFLTWANEWQLDMAVLLTHTRKSSYTAVAANVSSYTLPSDYLYALEVFYDQTAAGGLIKLGEVDRSELENLYGADWRQDVSSDPFNYYFSSTYTIDVYPPPNAANAGANKLQLFYIYAPVDLSLDTDSPDIPTPYHQSGKYFLAAQCMMKMENLPAYDRLMAFYDRQRSLYKQKIDKRSALVRDK